MIEVELDTGGIKEGKGGRKIKDEIRAISIQVEAVD